MGEYENIKTDFLNIREELLEVQKTFKEKAKTYLLASVKEIFNKVPRVTWIGWTQYTPYFNDGDECVFSVNDLQFGYHENYKDIYSPYEGIETWGSKVYGTYPDTMTEKEVLADKEIVSSLGNTLSGIDDSVFESIFGNHAFIRISRDGIDILDYDHD